MEIDLSTSIHTISSKMVRNYVYKALANQYKIENLRKYILQVSKECYERSCTINDVIEEVKKRIELSPTAVKDQRKRGRPPKNEADELATLFKNTVQIVEKPRVIVKAVRQTKKNNESKKSLGTSTKVLENSQNNKSSSDSQSRTKITTAQRTLRDQRSINRAVNKDVLGLSTFLSSFKMK